MSHKPIKWKLSEEKIFEIIHLTLIDILKEKEDKTCHLKQLEKLLNGRNKTHRINDNRKYNSFSKYLEIEHQGILNFIGDCDSYGVIKTDKRVSVKLYEKSIDPVDPVNSDDTDDPDILDNPVDSNYEKRITKDSEWILINSSD